MKKMFVLFVLSISLFGNTVFANDEIKVSWTAKKAFEARFPEATSPVWQELRSGDIYRVSFIYQGKPLIGFIGVNGTLVGIARSVVNEKLPFLVEETLSARFEGFTIRSADELIMDDEVSYLFSLESKDAFTYIRINSRGVAIILDKEKK